MSEKEALAGDLAGQLQSHVYPSEDAKRPLAHATSNTMIIKIQIKRVKLTGFVHWSKSQQDLREICLI